MQNADDLRRHFRLRPGAKVLVVSVTHDCHLERYWRHRSEYQVPVALQRLRLMGMTVPNYSFFPEAPQLHTHWNLGRMRVVAEELSDAGIEVIPHMNAVEAHGADYWTRLLQEQPSIRYVAREFQTGLRRRDAAERGIENLARIRDKIGRELHVVAVGAAQHADLLFKYFRWSFTVIDSSPFMKTMKRRRRAVSGRRMWEVVATPVGEPLDDLLAENIRAHRAWILKKCGPQPANTRPRFARQMDAA